MKPEKPTELAHSFWKLPTPCKLLFSLPTFLEFFTLAYINTNIQHPFNISDMLSQNLRPFSTRLRDKSAECAQRKLILVCWGVVVIPNTQINIFSFCYLLMDKMCLQCLHVALSMSYYILFLSSITLVVSLLILEKQKCGIMIANYCIDRSFLYACAF